MNHTIDLTQQQFDLLSSLVSEKIDINLDQEPTPELDKELDLLLSLTNTLQINLF